MWPSFSNRARQRASSFTTCLLTVVVVFGGIGFYYFNYFQWRHFENPHEGLTWVEGEDMPQLNSFRKKTVSSICDPTSQQLSRLKDIRKATKKGTEQYPDFEQDCTEVRNRLLEIMNEARLRRIPVKFKKEYLRTIDGIVLTYDSVNLLQGSFKPETAELRQKEYVNSIKAAKSAADKLRVSREYFHGSGWSN
jgi:hypothetical protein